MSSYRFLNITGAAVKNGTLEKHLEKTASNHIVKAKSDKQTYPIPRMKENYEAIKEVYDLLNMHLKLGIGIHPAGEWLLDNFYVIEEIVKSVEKELTLKKYVNLTGLQNQEYYGFARIYIVVAEIIAHTDNKIDNSNLENYLRAYQTNKTLSMDEIWKIGLFFDIVIIEKIRQICEVIYVSQIEKYKVESLVERLVEKKNKNEQNFRKNFRLKNKENLTKYPFIEYMSYTLKRYGKQASSYLNILEEIIEKTGTTVSNIIKKEHYNIALQKVSMGNCITSIKEIQRIDFLEIFEKINGVEEILKNDPAGVYEKMDHKTKEYYRNKIKEVSKKTKISEIYVAKMLLKLANEEETNLKSTHIGYYLIDEGINLLYKELDYNKKEMDKKIKAKLYIFTIYALTVLVTGLQTIWIHKHINNVWLLILSILFMFLPISELIVQLTNYILGKVVKPKLIPKIDFYDGIDEKNTCMVVIPTIVKTKEKVHEMINKLEVFYLANKSKNIYFTLLGDCSESKKRSEPYDQEVIEEGIKQVNILNEKYKNEEFPIFNFLYRSRSWNKKESCYIGWERKRGLLTQFNEYLLGHERNKFKANTIQDYKCENSKDMPNIKYIITLDSDTELTFNSAFELIGAMSHILNKPVLNDERNLVIDGHALIQPRVGVSLPISYKNLFTKIFAGSGGIDCYTNAISDVYQDNFGEGIFTGKGIYDLEVFSKVLKNQIPENTVLSHDLLEGSFLRCGLATDILLIDGYPTKYSSFMNRLSRWIRGDWQIVKWMFRGPLNTLSKYKIFDNIRRSMFEVFGIISIFYFILLSLNYNALMKWEIGFILTICAFPFLIEIIDQIVLKKEGEKKQKTFTPKYDGIRGAIARAIITIGCLPYKAYVSEIAKWKTIYRMYISHKHLLEWTTAEEAEILSKEDIFSYYKMMIVNVILGAILVGLGFGTTSILLFIIGLFWMITPIIVFYISRESHKRQAIERLTHNDKEYLKDIAHRTWMYFKEYLTEDRNYLIPDNYQEDRNPITVDRTSSTNIGLSILAILSGIDMNFIKKEEGIQLLQKTINTIMELPKWNGHLYNWYNIKTKEPLVPRYVSTVDSGNFVGYLYVLKGFLKDELAKEKSDKEDIIKTLFDVTDKMINDTNFKVLYSNERRLFSIGFNIEENKLTDSYYDLLASEARQASLISIEKGDAPIKHWNSLSRTMTNLGKYKGLLSWSGTAFEYLMPNINIPRFEGSLLDESCLFAIKSQIEYSKNLGIPWGISEAAFNAKDLYSNYQYKAFGIPWLGLKRGLSDEMVVASYGSCLALPDKPKEVVRNLKLLANQGIYNKYGFYESIDYTISRMEQGKVGRPVKTYMAHHQGLILLSINNLFNNNIFQKRMKQNPEIEAVSVLLQERMPEKFIITKESKEKPEELKYKDYENYSKVVYSKIDERLIRGNVISNAKYTVAINQKGEGFSKYKNYYINRFKKTDDYKQGILFYIKSIQSGKVWSSSYSEYEAKPDKYISSFMPDKNEFERIDGNIKTKMKITVAPNEPVEIRRLELENLGNTKEILEVTSCFEPILSSIEKDYAHPSFNNLFLNFEYNEELESFVIKRNKRSNDEQELYLASTLSADGETIGDISYEIDKEKFIGRGNFEIPKMVKDSIPLSKKVGLVVEPVAAMQRTIKLLPGEKAYVDLVISIETTKKETIENLKKYIGLENIKRTFKLSKARVEAESRYLGIKGKEIEIYQKMLSYIIFDNPMKKINMKKIPKDIYKQSELWKFGISGDLPIILVKIRDANDVYVVDQMLKAYEFFRSKNIQVEIVILDEENHSYENYVKEEIETSILNNQISYMENTKGGIFILYKDQINEKDINLLKFVSSIIIDSHLGNIENGLKDIENEFDEKYVKVWNDKRLYTAPEETFKDIDLSGNKGNLKYCNEYGAFSEDGKEYFIKINKNNRTPTVWSHVIANEKFGTIVTENMGGYTWNKNSRLNRVTAWHNHANLDIPAEVIYLKDLNTGKKWSLGANPMPDDRNYNIVYGFGYAKYIHYSSGVMQELTTFVPKEDTAKISILKLKNETPNKKKFKIVYYTKLVLGEDEIKSNGYIKIKYDANTNAMEIKKLYCIENINSDCFISSSEKIKSFTGDKSFFFGNGGIQNPDGLNKAYLNNDYGLGSKSCAAIEIEVELESYSEKEISLVLGAVENETETNELARKYSDISNCKSELQDVKNKWNELLGRINIQTPIESINIMLNGWIMYQTISSRMYAKSGFYQSGGAFGFRDQLQDTLGMKFLEPNYLKNQIIKHSKHQFIEGDVEHWWHDETKRGIRTRFSDDLLWLVYAVIEYIEFTGDTSILKVQTNYLQGNTLAENQDENYDKFIESDIKESIYMHCIRAIDKSLNFGENGLPKIGSGDWNDGFSKVGNKGKGESIWLGFFLYYILDRFDDIIEKQNEIKIDDLKHDLKKYEEIKDNLRKALNTNGWDGRWYKRAYMDNGEALGSMENDECKIDSIAQSWSVISGAGDNDKKYISMKSLENYLVNKEIGIIKLLDPPFNKGKLEPGYIKAYMPGVRENGGQYTHAAIWAIIAECMLGFGDKALQLYKMVNPIEHSKVSDAANKYKVEPYVIPADVYESENLAGRGGWTWYTGAASWYYKAGIEYILGLNIKKGILSIKPCIPKDWKNYSIKFKWENSAYNINVINKNSESSVVKKILLDGVEIPNSIKLDGSGKVFNIEVFM